VLLQVCIWNTLTRAQNNGRSTDNGQPKTSLAGHVDWSCHVKMVRFLISKVSFSLNYPIFNQSRNDWNKFKQIIFVGLIKPMLLTFFKNILTGQKQDMTKLKLLWPVNMKILLLWTLHIQWDPAYSYSLLFWTYKRVPYTTFKTLSHIHMVSKRPFHASRKKSKKSFTFTEKSKQSRFT